MFVTSHGILRLGGCPADVQNVDGTRPTGEYFLSILCTNYVDSIETVWRVIPFTEILWQNL